MKKDCISNRQMEVLIFIYGIGSYLLFNMGAELKQDAWIGTILSIVMAIPILMMYGKTMSYYPGKNLYEVLQIVFGKVIGNILNSLFILYTFMLCSYILNDFSYFISETALQKTPRFIEILCIGILSIWILKSGIEVLASWADFFIRIIIIFMVITWILLIPKMNISNLQPIFSNSLTDIVKGAIKLIVFPVNEVIIFLNFFDFIKYDKKIKNIFLKPVILSGIVSTVAVLINLMIIGQEEYRSFYYPGYESIRRLQIGSNYQRIEIIISIAFTIVQFLEINYCMLGVSKGIEKLFKLKSYKNIVIPTVFLMMNYTLIMFRSNMEAMDFAMGIWIVYGFFMQIILPFVIFVVIILKKKCVKIYNNKST